MSYLVLGCFLIYPTHYFVIHRFLVTRCGRICNEIASPVEGEFSAWGSDVTIVEGESGYYEPAKRLELVPGVCPEADPDKPFVEGTPSCPDVMDLTKLKN